MRASQLISFFVLKITQTQVLTLYSLAYKDHEYLIEISDILLETRSRFLCETCNQNNFGIRALILPEVNLSRF